MVALEISDGRKRVLVSIPETWEELSKKQFSKVAKALSISTNPALHRAMLKALGVPDRCLANMTTLEMNQILSATTLLGEWPVSAGWMAPQPWPFVRPRMALQNITGAQYAMADQWAREFLDLPDKDQQVEGRRLLRRMFASLHKLPLLGWSMRIADLYAALAVLVPRRYQMATLYAFIACTKDFKKRFPKTHKKRKAEGRDYGWIGLFTSNAGAQLGTPDKVEKTSIYQLMIAFERNCEAADRAESAREKAKRQR